MSGGLWYRQTAIVLCSCVQIEWNCFSVGTKEMVLVSEKEDQHGFGDISLSGVLWLFHVSFSTSPLSGPVEQLPDYNRIRGNMWWMRT